MPMFTCLLASGRSGRSQRMPKDNRHLRIASLHDLGLSRYSDQSRQDGDNAAG